MIHKIKWLLLVSLSIVACNNDEDLVTETPVSPGSANFTKYVAIGNSLTSGYADNGLFIAGQVGSYPNILATQFKLVGGGDFKQPLTLDNSGGLMLGTVRIGGPRLYFNGSAPVPVTDASTTQAVDPAIVSAGPYNNCGVPGAKVTHLLSPTFGSPAGILAGTANPYYVRFATNATTSLLTYATAQKPTFFSLWIGNNDVLGFATSGGDGSNPITPVTGVPGVGFNESYNAIVSALTAEGAKGVIANIPYVNSIPFFTTVPTNPLTANVLGGGNAAVGQATITALNTQLYGPLKAALTAFGAGDRINLLSATAPNPLLIKDESLTNLQTQLTAAFTPTLGAATAAFYGQVFGQARQANAGDYVLLTTQSAIGSAPTGVPAPLNKYGITYPLEDKHILIPSEVTELKTATDAFNVTIKAAADAKGLAFVDANALMNQIATTGIVANGHTMQSTFVTGGSFSLDGVHPSPRGYALIANYFFKAINEKYGSTFKGVDISTYRVLYPQSVSNF